ncbi:Piwi domain-containing protein [Caenorhabditis elegans]|uniref:Piwi domain-containing protein n=1 Tax=Caenorhabditis elegans TaxID=6239 RepID=Q17600_CAEEL|nr:Piwi domain-containing protein [Caenorhabditis elegans]CAA99766.1 Piwi domain-containing protein [Caenorhabditis elegans]|eukprot:NP_492571.1 Uncharacterized protein CELE_C03D6.1 [Caenorhabditis elegans]
MALRRRRHVAPDIRNNAHQYMRSLRGPETNTLFIGYAINHGTVDPSTPGVYNNPSTVVFTFNGTSCPDHFTEYFHFQKATIPHVDPALIRRVTRWIIEDFRSHREVLPDFIIVLRDQVRDDLQSTVEHQEFTAFKEEISTYIETASNLPEWNPRFAFGLAPWRPENTEPLVYLFQDDGIFQSNEEFQNLIVNMFITIRVRNHRFSLLEPLWNAENKAGLWTKFFPSYAAFREAHNNALPRIANSSQYDFDTISLQLHIDPEV